VEDESKPYVTALELHEEFVGHMEGGGKRMKRTSLLTVAASGVLAVLYFSQLVVLPFGLGVTRQTVDLTDPGLMATEAVVLLLTLLWLYTGVEEYRFAKRVSAQVEEIRRLQAQVAEKHGL
jgi:hypothetical protein